MSQPSNQPAPRYVVCDCQHCDGHIEFDPNEFAEENSIVPCPHCGLETKISIPISQAEKIPPKLPSSVASPNTARREGFFCGTSEILQERVGDEYPVATAPDLTEDQIRSVGKRQNDDMAAKLYHEGDQDVAMSLDDARRYIADPRFKLMNPETGVRFTPATLEAFIKAKRLEKKAENSQIKLNEAHINKCWKKYNELKDELRNVASEHGSQRISLTKAQCDEPVVQELIALLVETEKDGFVADDDARKLVAWLEGKNNFEIPAFNFLLETARAVLACGELTTRTIPEIDIALELQLAIERVLPKQVRDPIKAKRVEAVNRMRYKVPASKGVLDYIRGLGGTPRYGMTASEAEELKDELYHQPTTRQLEYIRDLGANPPSNLTRQTASELIAKLLHPVGNTYEVSQNTARLCENAPKFKSFQMQSNHYVIVELQQSTTEWREWRHNGIGASDASTIMGENRFKSAAQLLNEKRGPAQDYVQNAAMARGTELEPEARRLYIAKTGREVRPVCLQSTRYDWLRASLDGFAINCDAVVEIKCGQSAYRTAAQTGSVPDYYYGQIQHILAVTGLDSLDFWCYWPGCPSILIPVPRDPAYIERLLNRELEFWNLVQRR
jgi:putative phage-type endonuclease